MTSFFRKYPPMRRPFRGLVVSTFFLLFFFAGFLQKSAVLQAQEEEMDEELRSTIPTDPEMRGKRSPARPVATPPPAPAAATPSPPPPSSSPEDLEESEWKTMHSETHTGGTSAATMMHVDLAAQKIVTGKIGFKSNSDSPNSESMAILKQLALLLAKKPELKVRIEGHSDSVGPDQANLDRSQRRAENVKQVLIQNGIGAERLEAVGMGDKYPIASNITPEGQDKNRRVEFHLVGESSPLASPPPTTSVPTAPAAPVQPAPSFPTASLPPAAPPAASMPAVPATPPQATTPSPAPATPAP